MSKKIAFLCLNPWESFLPPHFQGRSKAYYDYVCSAELLKEEMMYCKEHIEVYGENHKREQTPLFEAADDLPEILYVQSHQESVLRETFETADLVIVGLPGSKTECDKIFLTALPWKEKLIFVWDYRMDQVDFIRQIQREYGLEGGQFMEAKKLPPFLTEAFKF